MHNLDYDNNDDNINIHHCLFCITTLVKIARVSVSYFLQRHNSVEGSELKTETYVLILARGSKTFCSSILYLGHLSSDIFFVCLCVRLPECLKLIVCNEVLNEAILSSYLMYKRSRTHNDHIVIRSN